MRNILVRGTIKVLIVDDSATMRAMIARIIDQQLDFEVVGVAASADQAEAILDTEEPDVVVLDHEMPGRKGLDFLRDLMADNPQRVVMLSSHATADSAFVEQAQARGAKGCFDKAAVMRDTDRFVQLLRRAAKKQPAKTSLSADIRVLHNMGLLGRGRDALL
jgi:two-component system, chemotaxis family, protein-glutamate methylesterase/glutaminase